MEIFIIITIIINGVIYFGLLNYETKRYWGLRNRNEELFGENVYLKELLNQERRQIKLLEDEILYRKEPWGVNQALERLKKGEIIAEIKKGVARDGKD